MGDNNDLIIKVDKLEVARAGKSILENISFALSGDDHLAITGPAGSGKTTLGLVLTGQIYYKGNLFVADRFARNCIWIEQQHHFKNLSNTTDLYYQQRFNSYDSEDAQTVYDSLGGDTPEVNHVLGEMGIGYLGQRPLVQLSNGENKKLQLAAALLSRPSALVMDQPFVGLDTATRAGLHELINQLASRGISIIVITSPDEIPECITKVIVLDNGRQLAVSTREQFLMESRQHVSALHPDEEKIIQLSAGTPVSFETVIKMKQVNIAYNGKKILDNIDWEVKQGERWLLSGHNGAGKSTLLSLVTADNPQSYANHIYLFDRKRGSGESIWDIKKKIGFLSPELHIFFDQGCTAFETVASGLFDTIGLFRQLSDEHVMHIRQWMDAAKVLHLQHKYLRELSVGEQRVVLLARALVKNPPLLILDEPCQGLDAGTENFLLQLIDAACRHGNKTMVYVTHYANKIPGCINKYIELKEGGVSHKL